ncbi:hypothetical protein [Streptomyces sp. CB03238]|uniref:hypothetical protein n=1 Tax=Streptomyces sp. CB03238 TaxID=1907777 RepID=UPI001F4EDE53|nr:hypothetical protein [Streptomyces sp. CB03238]
MLPNHEKSLQPDEAYAKAPSIISEIGWTAQKAADRPFGTTLGREFWLRKAAVLDRIALADEADGLHSDAGEVAMEAARYLVETDKAGQATTTARRTGPNTRRPPPTRAPTSARSTPTGPRTANCARGGASHHKTAPPRLSVSLQQNRRRPA